MSPLFNKLSAVLVFLFVQVRAAYAQDAVKLVFPPPGDGESSLTFSVGDSVPLQWTCTFPMFTLQIWQGPDEEGTKAFKNLQSRSNIEQEYRVCTDQPYSERDRYLCPTHVMAGRNYRRLLKRRTDAYKVV
jgi:hypothetical protein